MNFLSIGADPELFVVRGQEVVPVCGLLGGTKHSPLPVVDGAIQEDNVLAEFNIDVCQTEEEFLYKLGSVMQQVNVRLLDSGCTTLIKASHSFDEGALLAAGKQAMTFGCEPDLNVWTRSRQYAQPAGTLRTAGGHIHVGHDGNKKDGQELVKRLDLFLGVPSLLMDDDTMRRRMYGSAGSFRFKSYGLEYRSLSNFWLRSKEHISWAYQQTKRAVETAVVVPPSVKDVIDSNDKDAALALVNQYGLEVV